ncbi:MAG TPA: MBL fold metallo-hydrolase [Allosphingosinicella sp.]|jgi:glyoxylase-like metal-dependent hydrolase (beta-lactamase superfamily II)
MAVSLRVAALACLLLIGAASPPPPHALPADGYFQVIEKVADGIWVIRQAQPFHLQPIGNVVVVEQKDGLFLLDSGDSPGAGRRIAALVRSVSAKPVKAVAISHWHGDHSFGLPGLLESWPNLRIITTIETKQDLLGAPMAAYAKGGPDPAHSAAFHKAIQTTIAGMTGLVSKPDTPSFKKAGYAQTARELADLDQNVEGLYVAAPTETFADRLVLADPVRPVELVHPGRANTDGDLAIWLPRQKVLAAGDMVVAPIPYGFGSYPADWLGSLAKLRAYPFRVLIPGHGTPQRDRAYLDRLAGLIADVRRQVAPLAAAHASLDETRRKVDLGRERRLFAGDDPWLGLWFDQYWAEPFVKMAWQEASGIPISQAGG